ncbi:MAG: glycosyltransferase [Pseudomonadota bacterium]
MPFFDQIAMWASLDRRPLGCRVSGNIFKAPNDFGLPSNHKTLVNKYARLATYVCSIRSEIPCLFTFDESLLDVRRPVLAGRFRLLKDPAPDVGLFDGLTENKRADGRKVALFFGYISKRKGIFNLLSSLVELPEQDQKKLVIRISGRVKPELVDLLENAIAQARRAAPNIVIELNNKYLTEAEIAQEIMDASVILMPYENHVGSSGVLHWAATAKRPVIAQDTRMIGYLVTRYGLGKVVDVWNPHALANALIADVEMSDEKAADFVDGNTFEKLSSQILSELLA